jgi:hypothetical protein
MAATCPECGQGDLPAGARDCPACGGELRPQASRGAAEIRVGGRGIGLADGETVVLGRITGRAEVDAAFEGRPGVSRIHASVTRAGASVVIRDLGSRNGTRLERVDGREVAGAPVTRPLPLLLHLGRTPVTLGWPEPGPSAGQEAGIG